MDVHLVADLACARLLFLLKLWDKVMNYAESAMEEVKAKVCTASRHRTVCMFATAFMVDVRIPLLAMLMYFECGQRTVLFACE